jgi:2-oxoglutarate ferredoxin oxidoreductase subunit beta
MAAIGTAEMIHAANRAEKFTTVFVNNAIYGMTGGQLAPTTLVGQKAATAPAGRDPGAAGMGYPIRVSELLATLDGSRYIARGAVNNAANTRKTKQYIRRAFEAQMRGEGFTMVEVLSPCPTNWSMDPVQAVEWLENNMISVFPLGEIKNTLAGAAATAAADKAAAAAGAADKAAAAAAAAGAAGGSMAGGKQGAA